MEEVPYILSQILNIYGKLAQMGQFMVIVMASAGILRSTLVIKWIKGI